MAPEEPKSSSLVRWIGSLAKLPPFLVEWAIDFFRRRWWHPESDRMFGFRSLVPIVVVLVITIWWTEFHKPGADQRELVQLLRGNCWVTYNPTSWDPLRGNQPTPSSMHRDLRQIRAAGFTGIVTFGSEGRLAEIPRIAKSVGLRVIMGVWNAADVSELRAAIGERAFADAYCVGHNGLGEADGYTFAELEAAIFLLKRRTGHPVTTSEEVPSYKNPELGQLGDWLFPDIHVSMLDAQSWKYSIDLDRQVKSFVAQARTISSLAVTDGRPVMLKMVTAPWRGIPGASLAQQKRFFEVFLEALRSPEQGLPVRTSWVVHSAFDIPWKRRYPFYDWDRYTGVLAADGRPRPGARSIVERCR